MSVQAATPLHPPFTGAPLRVLVLLGCEHAPAWLLETLRGLASAPHVVADFVHVAVDAAPASPAPCLHAYLHLDRGSVGPMAAVLAPQPLPPSMLARRISGRVDEAGGLEVDPGALRTANAQTPQLIIAVGLPIPGPSLSDLACHGAWTLEPLACSPLACGSWMLDAFARGDATAVIGLRVHDSIRGAWVLLEPGVVSPPRLSFSRHRAYQLQKAPAQLLRSLRRLAEGSALRLAPSPPGARPHALATARLLARLALRAARRALRNFGGVECWLVAVRRRGADIDPDAPDVGDVQRLQPPPGWFWADPFPWRESGRDWVMLEALDYRSGRGEIQALELDSSLHVRAVHPVLKLDHHLSYPFVFSWNRQTWMVVESSAARRASLYRCNRFPDDWACVGDLVQGHRIVDPTLCEHEGRWWLFGCISESHFDDGGHESNELFAFHAPSPLGPWQPHAGNPVCSDVSRARPAGPLFRHGRRLVRPSQDGSVEYGRAVQFNHVVTLTPDHYEERPLGRLDAGWHRPLTGCHTYAFSDGLMAVDGKFRAPRSHARPRSESLSLEMPHAT